ncbi:thiolase family protein [Clostridium aminobutyricum]|uniref:Acetyl-CoA acetyltransferase n=1 Tax=Clostridium aminobutyricum TaxID=33953 RepID=A0A939D9Y0_CLOAM|nr:thiolase family protein [Clostridium aminobutyricum]MBN7774099.1 thiolase family protein [Clostridium aminobutyricum]
MKEVYIVSAKRTPIGDFMGALSKVGAVDLGILVAKTVVETAGISPDSIEEVVCGMVYKEGVKGNPARQIQLGAGFPDKGYASTIDQQCSSSMKAIELLSQQILLGKTEVGVAVGIENMSQAPHLLLNSREGQRLGDINMVDSLTYDALNCAMCGYHMGLTAENLAEKYGITREDQDQHAALSHERALKAQHEGKFIDEIIPVSITDRKGNVKIIDTDEHPKPTTFDAFGKLRPAFKKDGTVTAGNASSLNDGAAAVLLMSGEAVNKYGVKPIAKLVSTASYGVDPHYMGIGPVYAIPKALDYAGLTMQDINCFEINEAFAAQFLACNKELGIDMDKVNVNGSGIALGHPVGATGARIIVSLIHELKRSKGRYGVASLCVGGGPAMAAVIENLE